MTDASPKLSKEQVQLMNAVSMKTAFYLSLITLGMALLAVVPIAIVVLMITKPAPDAGPPPVLILVAVVAQFVAMAICGRFCLAKYIAKPAGKGKIVFAPESVKANSIRWTLISIGTTIVCAIVISLLPMEIPTSLGAVVTFTSYYLATYLIIQRLWKNGAATFEIPSVQPAQ